MESVKFKCKKNVKTSHGNYFTSGKTYLGYVNESQEPYAKDDNGKNFNLGYSLNDPWYKEHFKRA